MNQTRQQLTPQMLLSVLRELEDLPLRHANLTDRVLAGTIMQEVQSICPQMPPHLQNSWVNLLAEVPKCNGTSDFEESVALLKQPLGNVDSAAPHWLTSSQLVKAIGV